MPALGHRRRLIRPNRLIEVVFIAASNRLEYFLFHGLSRASLIAKVVILVVNLSYLPQRLQDIKKNNKNNKIYQVQGYQGISYAASSGRAVIG